ncbi:helix-turn-helix domain-containing protein [Actinoalloteichus caeruleus]|uniref:helix-turn-helix domain-containing protein n=1 Tax=Actinoalloteichus cyanogriseus TaxID=2893586 RepID=UPI0004AA263F|nr:helix-turn-helix transcriptional regulator [Actinoalloteichus caeruleus]
MSQDNGDVVNATVRRWQLTETLRQLRERAGLTIEQVAEQLRASGAGKWSRSKIGRIETREQGVRIREVEQLLDLYQVADANLRAWLLDLAATAHERGYWRAIRKDLPEDFHDFLNVEASLVALRQFETMLVPGLLQTPDYTRALISGASPGLASEVVERRVVARMARQQVLTRPKPLDCHVILEECILERPVGTPVIMRNQLRRLVEEAEADHVTLQVLPRTVGASPAMDGPFSVLTLPDPIPDFGYAESGGGAPVYIEDRDAVRACILKWAVLTERALPHADSVDLVRKAAKEYQ